MKNFLFFLYFAIILATQTGCERTRYFDVAVGNRLDSSRIAVELDGENVGTVDPGDTRQFTVEVRIRDNSPTGSSSGRSTHFADVTFWARDLRSRKLSRPVGKRLYTDVVTPVTFYKWDFRDW